ncbi:MAG TPA: flagellar basal body protein [Chloroflexota bacterium]|nr:flagellar basal body protein [Chloroflexota bacterium]
MSFDLFNDATTQGLEYSLNSLSLRQQVLANNVANTQTPGFTAQDVNFENQLSGILDGQTAVTPDAAGTVVDSPDLTSRIDGNSVSMESQMSKESQTNLLYNALTQLTTDRFAILKTAMS